MSPGRLAALIGGVVITFAAAGAEACDAALCQAGALDGFFSKLDEPPAGRPVHIVQIGDSHTAGDLITSSLRARLQARFGRGGRGVIPPGVPYAGYQPRQIEVFETEWPSHTPGPGQSGWPPTGVSGTWAMAGGVSARFEMAAEPGAAFDRVVVCGSGAGRLMLDTGATRRSLEFAEGGLGARCQGAELDSQALRLSLTPETGTVELHSIATFARDGLALSNLGVIGTTLADLAARDAAVVRAELAAWTPDLIILAYGTNEGFDPLLDIASYESLLRGQIMRLRGLAPEASLLILGAPDAMAPIGGGGCEGEGRWAAPAMLALVRDVQRRVAADMGVAFWDWHGRMGGDCSAHRLATAAEPLMRTDHVHFNSAGGDWIGRLIFDDLMAAYEARPNPVAATGAR